MLSPLSSLRSDFFAALTFLTRFGHSSYLTAAGVARGIPWHGLTGLLLGTFITLIPCFICMASGAPLWCRTLLAGWLWLCLEVWCSRGLHWDGIADLGDALGSGAVGSKFWLILKDSRMGAFGAMTLAVLMAGQGIAATAHFASAFDPGFFAPLPDIDNKESLNLAPLLTLAAAPAWSRLAPAWLGYKMEPHARHSLGAIICDNVTGRIWAGACLQGMALLLIAMWLGVGFSRIIILMVGQLAWTRWLRRQAVANGGASGDFFGCQIEVSQLLWLLGTV